MEFFTPGRTEIIGNHTDHQSGRVIASGVAQGIRAQAEPTDDQRISLHCVGYGDICVDLTDLSPREEERETTASLVRGVAAALKERGCVLGGFRGSVTSELPGGGGLSSSAAFAVLMGKILSGLYNGGGIDYVTLARCAKDAENRHFGKPSGLMDQLACAAGRAVYIDFLTEEITPLECDFAGMGLALCLTNTGGSHAGLTGAYAEIPADMRSVARELGAERLGELDPSAVDPEALPHDRAHDRARHFFGENERVPQFRDALLRRDGEACMALMNASGRSSEQLLRNIDVPGGDGLLAKGLALSARLLEGRGAWRVHGGGFAGCVQALLPEGLLPDYAREMEAVFGAGSCFRVL